MRRPQLAFVDRNRLPKQPDRFVISSLKFSHYADVAQYGPNFLPPALWLLFEYRERFLQHPLCFLMSSIDQNQLRQRGARRSVSNVHGQRRQRICLEDNHLAK